jgi:rhodanese-related sulfurtransferase
MKKSVLIISILFTSLGFSQETLDDVLKKYNSESIPYITVKELNTSFDESFILDARELEEFNVSHIKNATHVGYDDFDIETVTKIISDKSSKIVVYCSLGVRSEDIAEQLKKEGYTHVFNLYGGIFEWKNNDLAVYDDDDNTTENVHAYSKVWGKWLLKGIKIYD